MTTDSTLDIAEFSLLQKAIQTRSLKAKSVIILYNFQKKIVGAISADMIQIDQLVLLQTNSADKYLINYNGLSVYFSSWKIVTK